METVMISTKFHLVIPPAFRKALGIRPGQKVQLIQYQNRLELIPLQSARKSRGFLKGIDTTVERDPDRV